MSSRVLISTLAVGSSRIRMSRLADQCPGQEDALLLPAREIADVPPPEPPDTKTVSVSLDHRVVPPATSTAAGPARRDGPSAPRR